jgi:hypothetical protein
LHKHWQIWLTFTRLTDATSWAVNYPHWFWKIPKYIAVSHSTGWGTWSAAISNWSYDWTTNKVAWTNLNNTAWWNNSTQSIRFEDWSGNIQSWIITVDATNVTVTWTLSWSPASLAMYIHANLYA